MQKRQFYGIFVCLILFSWVFGTTVLAKDATLEKRVGDLEKELQEMKDAKKAEPVAPAASATDEAPWYQYIRLNGYIDTSYTYNFNSPANPAIGIPPTNPMRLYDPNATGFRFNVLELILQSEKSNWPAWLGFRTDVWIGQDAPRLASAGFNLGDDIEVQQGYIDMTAPLGNGLTFRVGKWTTLIDNEVDESADNYNFSRTFNFAFGIPASHLGILLIYPIVKDKVTTSWGVVNGWNRVDDTNHVPSFIGRIDIIPSDKFSFEVSGIVGAEDTLGTGNDSFYRGVVNASATIKPVTPLALVLSGTWGRESHVMGQPPLAPRHAEWWDLYGIIAFDIHPRFQLAYRGEYFRDPDGYRTFAQLQPAFLVGLLPLTNNYMWGHTLTGTFSIYKTVKARLEYRHDHASQPVFVKNVIAVDYQNTLTANLTMKF